MDHVRWLSGEEVRRALPMPAAVDAAAAAFRALHEGRVQMPPRLALDRPGKEGTTLVMPAQGDGPTRTAVKVVSTFPGNRRRGLPAIMGLVVLLDGTTGRPLAVLEGAALTAVRTGAASGAATRVLARPEAAVLAVVGAGAQAPDQVRAVCAVRPIQQVRLYNRTRERAEALAAALADELDAALRVVDTAADAVGEADVLCTATSATQPVVATEDLPPGLHVNAVGSFRPEMRELPRAFLASLRTVVVDQRQAALEEAGEVIDALAAGAVAPDDLVELGAILAGAASGRTAADEPTLFKSCGLAVQDLYAAAAAFQRAEDRDIGTRLPL